MTVYAIKCDTPALNAMAQKILFEKGYSWGWEGNSVVRQESGQYLVLRGKRITWIDLDQWGNRDRSYLQLINFSELVKL